MNPCEIRDGLRVKTCNILGTTKRFLIEEKNLKARQANKEGVVIGDVSCRNENVWQILHDDDTVGVYTFDEFEKYTEIYTSYGSFYDEDEDEDEEFDDLDEE